MSNKLPSFRKNKTTDCFFILMIALSSHAGLAQQASTNPCSEFTLNIKQAGSKGDTVRLLYHDCSDKGYDTVLVLNGEATYRGTVKKAVEAVLFTNIHNRILDGPHVIRFIIEPGPMTVSFSLATDTVRNVTITGSTSQHEKATWETVHSPAYDDSLLTNYRKARTDNDQELLKLYLHKMDSLYEKRIAAAIVYIKANPDSYFSGYLLRRYIRRIPLDSMQVYYTSLTDRVKQSQLGKDILSEVFARTGDMHFRKQNSDPAFFKQLETIKSLHDIPLTDSKGKVHRLSGLKGKYVVVDFWGSWCGPCFANIPYLKRLMADMNGKQVEVEFVSISIDTDAAKWKEAMAKHDYPGLNLWDTTGLAASYYKVPWVPKYVIIKPDGTLAYDDAPHPISGKLKPLLISIMNNAPGKL